MHLVIISSTPRVREKSNTARILTAFCRGFEKEGNTTEIWYLADRKQWEEARKAFENNERILFAIPLFVENLPGILLEFLETLSPKEKPGTRLAFLLQGGFAEASQLRCGERYLEMLPGYLNCEYAGTLIKGNMFAVAMVPEQAGEKMVAPFEEMGHRFAEKGQFVKEEVTDFAAPEYMSKSSIRFYNLIGSKIQKMFFDRFSKSLGCKGRLDDKPYETFVKGV